MRHERLVISFSAFGFLCGTLFLFQNFTSAVQPYEIDLQGAASVPLSEIVQATRGSNGTQKVEIKVGELVYIDKSVDVDELVINGKLFCNPSRADSKIEIKARVIYVNGLLQCGTRANPYLTNITFSLKPGNVDPRTSVAYRGLVVNENGKLVLTGSSKKSNWWRLNETAEPGQNYIVLNQPVDSGTEGWKVGDEVVIAPTSYVPTEAETFRITAVEGNVVRLNGSFLYRHWGKVEILATTYNGKVKLDDRAEVANLTRNILIRADESTAPIAETDAPGAELGGHVMIMPGGAGFIDSVEFSRMGQAGMMARYPFHWHIVGNAPGQYITNSSIHNSFQRCITVHRTNQVVVDNNVCSNFKGHGFFLEDGIEVDNTLTRNLGINAKYPYASKALLASDQPTGGETSGRFPNVSVFWISHPRNVIKNNTAAGSVGSGFWMAFDDVIYDSNGKVITRPINENTTLFDSNVAHTGLVGFTWDGAPKGPLTGNPNNPKDRALDLAYYKPDVVPVFSRLAHFKNKHTGIYFRGFSALYDQGISADNGWHYWLAYNEIVRNSVIIGRSQNFTPADQAKALSGAIYNRVQHMGIVEYDGPFELDGVDFMNFPTQKVYYGQEVTPAPIGVIGGTERLTNSSKKVAFSPEPIHRVFMKGPETYSSMDVIGNASIRDHDGTLTGMPNGGMVIAQNSMAVLPTHGCVPGGLSYNAQQLCPPSYTETEFHLFNGDGNTNPWSMPFAVRRSDGMISDPFQYWNLLFGLNGYPRRGGNKFTLANSNSVSYELMVDMVNPMVWVNAETKEVKIPVTKVIGRGNNCVLTGAPQVSSLDELKASTVTAYYTKGDDLFIRMIPYKPFYFMVPNSYGTAKRYSSDQHNIQCSGPVTPFVKGKIEVVQPTGTSTSPNVVVSGWACNYAQNQQIPVKLYVGGPLGQTSIKSTLLQSSTANLVSDAPTAFNCALPKTTGLRFQFTIPASLAAQHAGKTVYVYGYQTSGGTGVMLEQSGSFTIPTGGPVEAPIEAPIGTRN